MNPLTIKTAWLGLALAGVTSSAWAQPAGQTNYQWSAAGDKTTWSQGANWTQLIPPPADGTTYQIDTYANAGGSTTPIYIASTNVVKINDAIFGPVWGQTLDVYGSVSCGFGEFVWGDLNAGVTTLNIHTNGSLAANDTLALGTAWWFAGGPHVVLNVSSNAFVGCNWMQFGAKLNIFAGGTVSVTNGFNTGGATTPVFSGGLDTDATRAINLAGGTLVLPGSYSTTVTNWIQRGIVQVYGVPNDGSEILIDEANVNWPGRTVVTTTATNSNPMLDVHVAAPRTNLFVGGQEQVIVYADYASSTNVNVSSLAGVNISYLSTATNVVTIATNGYVRAVGTGTAQVRAIVGSLSNSVTLTVGIYTNHSTLIHRYSFKDAAGNGTAADSVGGTDWTATLNNSATLTGSNLVLASTTSDYVQFPAGIITNLDAVTIETWASFGATITNWACFYAFGNTDSGGSGMNYITFQPHTYFGTMQIGLSDADPGNGHEQDAYAGTVLDGMANLHIVAVYNPNVGYTAIYTNGVQAALDSNISITLAAAVGADPLNYLGRSLYNVDPYIDVTVDEFRIYSGALTAGQIRADAALGPNQVLGANTNVVIKARLAGGQLNLAWPANSALVTVLTSPVLGAQARWTEVPAAVSLNGTNFQVSLPYAGTNAFYRLSQ